MIYNKNTDPFYYQRVADWTEIESLVLSYQLQFHPNSSNKDKNISKSSADKLLEKFSPLFKKYLSLIKTSQIKWDDCEMKSFVKIFISDKSLTRALNRKKQTSGFRKEIYENFYFVTENYGSLPCDYIYTDLQMLLLTIAKRYKKAGKNFCSYVYNCYKYEVFRHIKKFLNNPINLNYKNKIYDDTMKNKINEENTDLYYEDNYYEDLTGIPNNDWILGESCSDAFSILSPLDRKILIKYYLEEWNDKQIAECFGMHINTANQRRRNAAKIVANNLNLDVLDIKRSRRSGKKAILPIE